MTSRKWVGGPKGRSMILFTTVKGLVYERSMTKGGGEVKSQNLCYVICEWSLSPLFVCMIVDEPEWPAVQRGEFYGFISGTTNLTCEANAEPPAQFTWLDKNNNEIIFGQVYNQDHKSTLSVRLFLRLLYTINLSNRYYIQPHILSITGGSKLSNFYGRK